MRKILGTICSSLTILVACSCSCNKRMSEAHTEQAFVGKPAALAIDHFEVRFDDLKMLDEPRCILSAIFFDVSIGDHVQQIYLWLDSDPPLVSEDRHWDYEAIRKAKVIKITHDPYY